MIKEYCDRCKNEIPVDGREKKVLQITYPTKGYRGHDNNAHAKVTLCEKCFSEMGIDDVVKIVGAGTKEEKNPDMVERLLDIFRELITECMEE